jgi:hypothetical protein
MNVPKVAPIKSGIENESFKNSGSWSDSILLLKQGLLPARISFAFRWALLLVILVTFLYCFNLSWHWHVVQDASIMHYVVFLMDHGMAPYRQIIDINGPGAYMSEWLVMHTFGAGSFAWRMYDLFLILGITGIFVWLTAPRDWMAGAFAGLSLGVYHLGNGPNELGERDWTMLFLMLVGYAFLFLALRHRRAWPMLLFGLGFGCATTIKPLVAPIPFILLLVACVVLYRRGVPLSRYVVSAFLGAIPPMIAFFAFLYYWHAFHDFYTTFRDLVSFYVGFNNPPMSAVLDMALAGRYVRNILILALVISVWLRNWREHEMFLLLIGIASGLVIYLAQRKGFIYHRATLCGFAFLWVSIQGYASIGSLRRWRWLGSICLLLFLAGAFRHWVAYARITGADESRIIQLEGQLNALGGHSLNGDVQCVDMVQGCINTLYNLRLVQSTGFVSDFFLFRPTQIPIFVTLRARFLADLEAHPPKVLIVAPYAWDGGGPTYKDLNDWPAFPAFVKAHYVQKVEEFAPDGTIDFFSYRLYVRR